MFTEERKVRNHDVDQYGSPRVLRDSPWMFAAVSQHSAAAGMFLLWSRQAAERRASGIREPSYLAQLGRAVAYNWWNRMLDALFGAREEVAAPSLAHGDAANVVSLDASRSHAPAVYGQEHVSLRKQQRAR